MNAGMTPAERRLADLEGQVAELAAEVTYLKKQAFIVRTLEEARTMRAGTWQPPRTAHPRRQNHLRAVSGSAS